MNSTFSLRSKDSIFDEQHAKVAIMTIGNSRPSSVDTAEQSDRTFSLRQYSTKSSDSVSGEIKALSKHYIKTYLEHKIRGGIHMFFSYFCMKTC